MIRLGQRDIDTIYYGDKPVTAVYRGAQKIWPANAEGLAATLAAQSYVSGSLLVPRHLSTTLAAHSSILGNINTSKSGVLAATIASHSDVSGSIQVPRHLGATIGATSSLIGDIDTESSPSGYSCTMTAGNLSGIQIGYFPALSIGSIDQEPVPGETLILATSQPSSNRTSIGFQGDIVSLLSGLDVWVEGVNQSGSGWSYDSGTDATGYVFGNGSEFIDQGVYFIEIK